MPETHEKAYEYFKKTREQLGLSLADIANALHLTVTVLEKIEAGEFAYNHLAPVFMRGYIRSYAKYLNLPEKIVQEIVSTLEVEPVQKVVTEKLPVIRPPQRHRDSIKKILACGVVIIVLVAIAFFWHKARRAEVQFSSAIIEQPENIVIAPEAPPISVEPEGGVLPQPEADIAVSTTTVLPAQKEVEVPLLASALPPPTVAMPVKKVPKPSKGTIPPRLSAAATPEVIDAQETP